MLISHVLGLHTRRYPRRARAVRIRSVQKSVIAAQVTTLTVALFLYALRSLALRWLRAKEFEPRWLAPPNREMAKMDARCPVLGRIWAPQRHRRRSKRHGRCDQLVRPWATGARDVLGAGINVIPLKRCWRSAAAAAAPDRCPRPGWRGFVQGRLLRLRIVSRTRVRGFLARGLLEPCALAAPNAAG